MGILISSKFRRSVNTRRISPTSHAVINYSQRIGGARFDGRIGSLVAMRDFSHIYLLSRSRDANRGFLSYTHTYICINTDVLIDYLGAAAAF